MLKIRLRRTGARKKPNYRIVVAESTAPRDGAYVEIIGTYDPLTDPSTINLDGERAKHWLSVGAQPTERVVKLMAREGLIEAPSYTKPAATAATAEGAPAPAAPAEAEAAPAPAAAATAVAEPEAAATDAPADADAE